ncbi:hypothetical protein M8J75_014906 [Diaphorina citri]|nr:hypothetical protein M8J75_014906 [Diaphorina citri]
MSMDDYSNEPLNLVKRKPKPVAIVAPSATLKKENSKEINEDDEEEEEEEEEMMERNNNEQSIKGEEHPLYGGVYSMVSNLAVSDPNFLTTLYMGSLLNRAYDPTSNNNNNNGNLATSPTELSTYLAQQRFWQMVKWHDSMKLNGNTATGDSLKDYADALSISIQNSTLHSNKLSHLASSRNRTDKANSIITGSHHNEHKNSSSSNNNSDNTKSQESSHSNNNSNSNDKKKPHIKKPLNAFMLYMKEMRAKVVAECTLKESAAINQILGRRWHSLTREEQAKYYEKARQERQLHMELYPGWSARDNYGYGAKKKKRKKERAPIIDTNGGTTHQININLIYPVWHALGRDEQAKYYELARRERQLHMQLYPDWSSRANQTRGKKRKRNNKQEPNDSGNSMKKCRARYGLDQQSQWCKPCSPDERTGAHLVLTGGPLLHGASNVSSPQGPTYVNL